MNLNAQINDLIDAHPDFLKCPGCEQCERIQELGRKLERTPTQRYQHILAKGPEMSTNEVTIIIANGVPKDTIQKALEMDDIAFKKIYKHLKPKPNSGRALTSEEYIACRRNYMSLSMIATKFDVSETLVLEYLKKWRKSGEISEDVYRSLPRVKPGTKSSHPFTKEQYIEGKEKGWTRLDFMEKYKTTKYAVNKATKYYKGKL